MKIHILFTFQSGPYGGGNQFLKALKKQFAAKGAYEENIGRADIILFNSFQQIGKVIFYRCLFPGKIFVHRVDGPISLYRGRDQWQDRLIFHLNERAADGTVFQSGWSQKENHGLGMKVKNEETVINNAADSEIFNAKGRRAPNAKNKIRLVACSWSDNWNKGFSFYKFLDENLNFNKYSMTFIGRSPVNFRNIKMHAPLTSEKLASALKLHDIFITASKNDPCSNVLIEAQQCGLPAVFRKSGGHSEIVRRGGEGYTNEKEMLEAIDKIARHWVHYHDEIEVKSIASIAAQYLMFFKKISAHEKTRN